jgi:hypothetical protein
MRSRRMIGAFYWTRAAAAAIRGRSGEAASVGAGAAEGAGDRDEGWCVSVRCRHRRNVRESGMVERPAPSSSVPVCPHCQSKPTFVGSWTFRGLWGYNEVHTYECDAHGPLFVPWQVEKRVEASHRTGQRPDDGDRDSLIAARRRPTPTLNSAATALPEPDSDGTHGCPGSRMPPH